MSSKSMPPPPNYMGLAQAQGEASRQLTAEQTYANRPNVNTPFGSISWDRPNYDPWFSTQEAMTGSGGGGPLVERGYSQPGNGLERRGGLDYRDGGSPNYRDRLSNPTQVGGNNIPSYGSQPPDPWTMNVHLTPELQQALEAQQRIGAQRSGLAEDLFGRARGELGQGPDWSQLPEGAQALGDVGGARSRAEEALYQRATSRLDPEWSQREAQLSSRLAAQGISPGSAAYTQAMGELERAREGAYAGARQEAIMGGGAEAQREQGLGVQAGEYASTRRQQAIAEQLQRRGYTLNEINALLSGQQVGMPQFPGFAQAGQAQAPNLVGAASAGYGAALQKYGIDQAQLQSLLSGGFGMAGAAMPFLF